MTGQAHRLPPAALLVIVLLPGCYDSGSNPAPPIRDTGTTDVADTVSDEHPDLVSEPATDPAPEPEPDLFDPCSPENMCTGMECGWNEECMVDCGTCPEGIECVDHRCPGCERSCDGRACGIDACGRHYGTCPGAQICNQEGECEDASWAEPCREVVEESHFCLAVAEGYRRDIAVIGVDSGVVCPLGLDLYEDLSFMPSGNSIAWLGRYLHLCSSTAGDASLKRISLADGTVENTTYWCYAAARYGDGLLVKTFSSELALFPSFEAVFTYDGVAVPIWGVGDMTAHCNSLYTWGHVPDEIVVYDLPEGGEPAHNIGLEFETICNGASVTDDGLLIVNTVWPEEALRIYDVHTGEFIEDVPLELPYSIALMWGLDCTTNP
jgi:hypothetical protein